jgi:WD40 repeat protein
VILIVLILAVSASSPEDRETPVWAGPSGPTPIVWSVAFTSDGRRLATGDANGVLVLWEVGWGAEHELPSASPFPVPCLGFSPDGATLAAGSFDATVALWDVATRQKRATLQGHSGTVQCLAFSPDGKTLATGSADRSNRLWDNISGQLKAVLS